MTTTNGHPASPRYEAICLVCYRCVIGKFTKKKDAERACTGHINAYGHDVYVSDTKAKDNQA